MESGRGACQNAGLGARCGCGWAAAAARPALSAGLPRLRRAGRRPPMRSAPSCFRGAAADHRAALPGAGPAVRGRRSAPTRSRPKPSPIRRRSSGRARRCSTTRWRARWSAAQIWRPARAGAVLRAADGAGRARALGRTAGARAGAAASRRGSSRGATTSRPNWRGRWRGSPACAVDPALVGAQAQTRAAGRAVGRCAAAATSPAPSPRIPTRWRGSEGGGWCWSTTSSPPARRSRRSPGRSTGLASSTVDVVSFARVVVGDDLPR